MNPALEDLYALAEQERIAVDRFPLAASPALTVRAPDGTCHIALTSEKPMSEKEEAVFLSHELGHCQTGAFYARLSPYDLRTRQEYRADKWAVHRLIPPESYRAALRAGLRESWELAEHFGVTEDFIRRAREIYENEGVLKGQEETPGLSASDQEMR